MANEPRYAAILRLTEPEPCPRCGMPGPHAHPELNSHLRPNGHQVRATMAPGQMRHLVRLVRAHRKRAARQAERERDFQPEPGALDSNLAAIELDGALENLLRWEMERQGFDPDSGSRYDP